MTNEEEQYVTLFQEGDGRVDLQDNGYKKYPRVFFFQMERDVLDYIASLTKGGLFYQDDRGIWQLRFNSSHCMPLLEVFSRHAVSKWFVERLNEVLEYVGLPSTTQHPLTREGLVAFWDAEGTSDRHPQIGVTQTDGEILDIIAKTFGGSVCAVKTYHQWYLCGEEARELAKILLEKSHCPAKRERLRENFEGPTYYEKNREKMLVQQKQYELEHAEERKVYHKKHGKQRYDEQKLIRDYIKSHGITLENFGSGGDETK